MTGSPQAVFMNLLALNTSGFSASLALGVNIDDENSVGIGAWSCRFLDEDQKSAQFLIPAIHQILEVADLRIKDINRFACTTGPGSFTGIRIGVTTVKSLAYATGADVAGINSLAAIAQNAKSEGLWTHGKLSVIINAFRKQIFLATFDWSTFDQDALRADELTETVGHAELERLLVKDDSLVAGPGIAILSQSLQVSGRLIDAELNESARGVGELAVKLGLETGQTAFSLLPNYFRPSAAEDKLTQADKQ